MKTIILSRKAKDLTGQSFGRLVALRPVGKRANTEILWFCLCDCHNTLVARGGLLTAGVVQSCGCLQREGVAQRSRKHGMYGTPVYRLWRRIARRCADPSNSSYGGRGISVCNEWRNNFETFYDYVSKLPHYGEEGRTLDRVDNDGDYEPGNVRWATRLEQARNKRTNRMLIHEGETMTMVEWAKKTGINYNALCWRISKGWSVERALTTPTWGLL